MTEIGRGNDLKDPRQGDEDALSPKTTPLSSSKSSIEDPVTCHPQLDWGSSAFFIPQKIIYPKLYLVKSFNCQLYKRHTNGL